MSIDRKFSMKQAPREIFVIDPVWKLINSKDYERLWKMFSDDCEKCGFIGFDMEWSFEKAETFDSIRGCTRWKQFECEVATVQLSSLHVTFVVKFIDLFRLVTNGKLNDPFAPASSKWPRYRVGVKKNSVELMTKIYKDITLLLRNDTVIKVGVGIYGDQIKFERDYQGLKLSPCLDLVVLAEKYPEKELDNVSHDGGKVFAKHRDGKSLKTMCAWFAGRTLNKDHAVIRSNWGGALGALSKIQISYAAADAEASFDVCQGILVKAGLVSDILSASSTLDTSCPDLLKPLIDVRVATIKN